MGGDAEAARLAARKKGLKRTFLQEMTGEPVKNDQLGASTALGSYGAP